VAVTSAPLATRSGAEHSVLRPWSKIRYSTARCGLVGTSCSEHPSWALKTKRPARAKWPHGLAACMQRRIVFLLLQFTHFHISRKSWSRTGLHLPRGHSKHKVWKWKATL